MKFSMNLPSVLSWLRQPTSIIGLAGLAGTGTSLALGQITVATGMPILVGSLVGLVLPDNTSAKYTAMRIAAEALTAGTTRTPAAISALVADAANSASSVVSASTVAEVAATVAAAAPIVAAVKEAAAAHEAHAAI